MRVKTIRLLQKGLRCINESEVMNVYEMILLLCSALAKPQLDGYVQFGAPHFKKCVAELMRKQGTLVTAIRNLENA